MFNPATFNLNATVAAMNPAKPAAAPMVDPPDVAAWRAQEQARLAQMEKLKGTSAGFTAGITGGGIPAMLPTGLQSGIRKLDNSTAGQLAQGVPYETVANLLPWQYWFETTPMSEGGGAEEDPGLLDFILPAAMGFATGGIGALNGLSGLGSAVLGATTSGLLGQGTASLPLVGAGMGVVGAGAADALGSAWNNLTTGNGFTNTDFGWTGQNLNLPGLANAPAYVPPPQGVGIGALNYVDSLGRAVMEIPGLNLANAPKPTGTNQYPPFGLKPEMLYNPQALGGPEPKSNLLNGVADALKVASAFVGDKDAPAGRSLAGAPGVEGGITGAYRSTTPFRQVQPFRRVVNGANPFLMGALNNG